MRLLLKAIFILNMIACGTAPEKEPGEESARKERYEAEKAIESLDLLDVQHDHLMLFKKKVPANTFRDFVFKSQKQDYYSYSKTASYYDFNSGVTADTKMTLDEDTDLWVIQTEVDGFDWIDSDLKEFYVVIVTKFEDGAFHEEVTTYNVY